MASNQQFVFWVNCDVCVTGHCHTCSCLVPEDSIHSDEHEDFRLRMGGFLSPSSISRQLLCSFRHPEGSKTCSSLSLNKRSPISAKWGLTSSTYRGPCSALLPSGLGNWPLESPPVLYTVWVSILGFCPPWMGRPKMSPHVVKYSWRKIPNW